MFKRSRQHISGIVVCLLAPCLVGQTGSNRPEPTTGKALQADVDQHINNVTSCLTSGVLVKGDPKSCATLADRMAQLHVPGVSIAVIHNGAIEWARGFGVVELGGAAVDADTMFQAGSISKPVAAMAALRLVDQKKLALDADVNTELKSWKVPDSVAAKGKPVTLRELLTHTAGMTVHGFPGYAAGAPVPTVVQVLNGEPPANTPAIRVESEPGSEWKYSGGGYTVMLQTVMDVTKEPFPKLMHDTVLAPIGMTHSTYEQPLPEALRADAAVPYNGNGKAVVGGAHTYPEMTAAGLWTTATDMARYCLEMERSLDGKANHVLTEQMTKEMATAGKGDWGLGLQIGGSKADPYFTHGGSNAGFEGDFVAYEHHGDGAVVLTNAQGGGRLADEVVRSIATEYGWPDLAAVVHTEIKVPTETLEKYVGVYQFQGRTYQVIRLQGDQLTAQLSQQQAFPIFAEADGKFFFKVVEARLDFVQDASGKVTGLVQHQNGRDSTMPRLGDAEAKTILDEQAAKDALAAKRFAEQKPQEGSEAAIRKDIADIEAGTPDYDHMSEGLANATKSQLAELKALFAQLGAIKSVQFMSVDKNGGDTYTVEFEHGKTEFHILMGTDGKVESLGLRPMQ